MWNRRKIETLDETVTNYFIAVGGAVFSEWGTTISKLFKANAENQMTRALHTASTIA